jgi:hypothetical protein
MAQLKHIAAAIAAASVMGVANAAPTIEFDGEVAFESKYVDQEGSSSQVVLDTADFNITATEGNVTAYIGMDAAGDVVTDNAGLEYKINDNYTVFAKYDDTYITFAKKSMKWNDTLSDTLVDHDGATMTGVKISGGPISSTLYLTNGTDTDSEDDLQEFGSKVAYSHEKFNASFGYISVADGTGGQGAFSVAGDVALGGVTLVAEYNWLSDKVDGEEPTFLQVAANYEMNGYSLTASYETVEEGSVVGEDVEDRIALAVDKSITDALWVSAELDIDEFSSESGQDDATSLYLVAGFTF